MKATVICTILPCVYLFSYFFVAVNCEKTACTKLIKSVTVCAQLSIQISGCYGDQESKSLNCIREAVKDIYTCDNEMIQKMVLYALKMNEEAEKIICKDSLHLAFGHNEQCWNNASLIVAQISDISMPFLNEVGCRVKRMVALIKLQGPDTCGEQLQKFSDDLYAISPCAGISGPNPRKEEIENCSLTMNLAFQCYLQSQSTPRCDVIDQPFYSCLDRLDVSACWYFPVQHGIETVKKIYNEYVFAYCKNSTYRDEILQKNCWAKWVPRTVLWKSLFEVFGSAEACSHVKFLWDLQAETDDSECIPLMKKVDDILENDLQCLNSSSAKFKSCFTVIFSFVFLVALQKIRY